MSTEMMKKELQSMLERITETRKDVDILLKDSKSHAVNLSKAIDQVSRAHSGSWIGYHADLYFGNFIEPDLVNLFNIEWGGIEGIAAGWQKRCPEMVRSAIEARASGSRLDELRKIALRIIGSIEPLKRDLAVTLAPIRDEERFEREAELLVKLEELQWKDTSKRIIKNMSPGTYFSRDSHALAQGIITPEWIIQYAKIESDRNIIYGSEGFLNDAEQLVKQIQIKIRTQLTVIDPEDGGLSVVKRVCERFYLVANQLESRQRDRPPFQIDDEYDVQYLMHALLRLHFDDVRPEEWTPKYAGGAARMDFLLKHEKIVVETKKTRETLGAKQIGEELLIDIAKYKEHKDCKTLVCFVYDPARIIPNPRGFESDLLDMSTESLSVIAIISPT